MNRLRFIADSEKIKIEDDALLLVAKKGDGSMRDSQSIFDQIVSFCGDDINAQKIIEALNLVDQEIFFRTTDLIKNKDASGGISLVEEIISHGYDIKEFLSGLNEHLRNFLIAITTKSTQLIETAEVYKKRYQSDTEHFSESDLLRLIKIVTETENSIKWIQQPRFKLEVALIQMIKMENTVQISELLTKIDELKKKLSSGIPVGGKVLASPPSMSSTQKFENKNALLSSIASTNISYPFIRETAKPSYINTPYQQTKSVVQVPENQIIETTQQASLTFEEASVKWKDVVMQARQERVTLGSSLGLTQVIECNNGSLKIACPDNFNLDFFKRNRDRIHSLAEKVYGIKFRLEAILADIDTSTSTSPKKSVEQQTETHHPVVEALKTKLGAVKVK
jgi:DNA polymerase-3 subunit gamma/tau